MDYPQALGIADERKAQIDGYGVLSAELKRKIDYRFRLEWNYFSNRMEGNTLSKEETRSIMIGNISVHDRSLREIWEMHGHDQVISDILRMGRADLRLSEKRIKEVHKLILYAEDAEDAAKLGQWKQQDNYLYNYRNERSDFLPYRQVPEAMHQLLGRTNAAIDRLSDGKNEAGHPLDIAFDFHIDYLAIHPFWDANGRTARICSNILLISLGYPPFWLDDADKAVYYRYLADIQCYGGDSDAFKAFLTEKVLRAQQIVLDALEGKGDDGPF
jgi:Fic family protein